MEDFQSFGKIPRLNRQVVITEKIDGTNAQILIHPEGGVQVGSRKRWITPSDDNYGFARWCMENHDELMKLGPGRHFGEWWGLGIQRGYGLDEKRFSLFNTGRWNEDNIPKCCHVVPVLYQGLWAEFDWEFVITDLALHGSRAVPGFMKPEGIIIYHCQGNQYFKVTVENDEVPKFLADKGLEN